MANVGNRDQQTPRGASFSVPTRPRAKHGIVEITRIFAIDRDKGDVAQIDPTFQVCGADCFGQCRSLFFGSIRELVRHIELAYRDFDLHARIVDFAQHLDHTPDGLQMARRLAYDLHSNHLAIFSAARIGRRDQDIVLDTLVFGHDNISARSFKSGLQFVVRRSPLRR